MIYLLDANVLIDANRDYYPIQRVPEFWEWLEYYGNNGLVKIPFEIFEEIKEGNDTDDLTVWVKRPEIISSLLLEEEMDVMAVSKIINLGYAIDLTDDEVETLGNDPFLIAYAYRDVKNRCIVTTEISKPSKQRANRHIPDICNYFGISWINTYRFINDLNFRTNWKTFL